MLPRFFELVRRGKVFSTMVKTVTVAATHNSPIAAATATPVLGLHNPATSGKTGVLLRHAFGTTSGTPAGGQGIINQMLVTTAPTGAQAGSIFSHLNVVAGSKAGSIMNVFNNTALTGIVPTASNEIALVGAATAAAVAGNAGPSGVGEDLGGLILMPPGSLTALMAGTGAGTSWIVNASWTWAEVEWVPGAP